MNASAIRLLKSEIEGIINALSLAPPYAKLYLYGSRTNPSLHGGDIDLLLVVQHQAQKEMLSLKKHYLIANIKKAIGDQRIDLSIAAEADIETDPFLSLIWPKAILLHQW